MLQDKYGRLIIVGVFIVIGIVLLIAPGMNSKNKALESEQLNFTSMPQADSSVAQPEPVNENAATQTPVVKYSPEIAGEEGMLDAWGMRPSPKNHEDFNNNQNQSPKEQADNIVKQIAEEHSTQQALQPSEVQKPQPPKPNTNLIKVNGRCFAKPKVELGMTKDECNSIGTTLGIQACGNDSDRKDGWAGAVRACGGVEKMPSLDDLLAISRILYNSDNISVKTSDRSKYRAYGNYTPEDIEVCDTFQFKNLLYKKEVAEKIGFPTASGYQIWGKAEINPKYALSLFLGESFVTYNGCSHKAAETYYALCEVPCN